jgi:hypothetical protein
MVTGPSTPKICGISARFFMRTDGRIEEKKSLEWAWLEACGVEADAVSLGLAAATAWFPSRPSAFVEPGWFPEGDLEKVEIKNTRPKSETAAMRGMFLEFISGQEWRRFDFSGGLAAWFSG